MNPRNELAGILEEWLQLTQAEGSAISKAAWPVVARIQARKAAVRKSFLEATRNGGLADKASQATGAKVARILSLLRRNASALAAQFSKAQDQQEKLNRTRQNLRKIQRSYACARAATAWHSYS
jgi:hypothetical protein